MFNFGPDTVEFCVLMDARQNWDQTVESLKSEGVEIVQNNAKVSDYLTCRADKATFCRLFNTRLKYRTMKVGSYELKKPGSIPENLDIKSIILKRNILLPSNFIKHHTIHKTS